MGYLVNDALDELLNIIAELMGYNQHGKPGTGTPAVESHEESRRRRVVRPRDGFALNYVKLNQKTLNIVLPPATRAELIKRMALRRTMKQDNVTFYDKYIVKSRPGDLPGWLGAVLSHGVMAQSYYDKQMFRRWSNYPDMTQNDSSAYHINDSDSYINDIAEFPPPCKHLLPTVCATVPDPRSYDDKGGIRSETWEKLQTASNRLYTNWFKSGGATDEWSLFDKAEHQLMQGNGWSVRRCTLFTDEGWQIGGMVQHEKYIVCDTYETVNGKRTGKKGKTEYDKQSRLTDPAAPMIFFLKILDNRIHDMRPFKNSSSFALPPNDWKWWGGDGPGYLPATDGSQLQACEVANALNNGRWLAWAAEMYRCASHDRLKWDQKWAEYLWKWGLPYHGKSRFESTKNSLFRYGEKHKHYPSLYPDQKGPNWSKIRDAMIDSIPTPFDWNDKIQNQVLSGKHILSWQEGWTGSLRPPYQGFPVHYWTEADYIAKYFDDGFGYYWYTIGSLVTSIVGSYVGSAVGALANVMISSLSQTLGQWCSGRLATFLGQAMEFAQEARGALTDAAGKFMPAIDMLIEAGSDIIADAGLESLGLDDVKDIANAALSSAKEAAPEVLAAADSFLSRIEFIEQRWPHADKLFGDMVGGFSAMTKEAEKITSKN